MGFKPGNKLSGSRLGRPNKRSQEVKELLANTGFCPTLALVEVHKIAMARFVEELEKVEADHTYAIASDAVAYLKIAGDMAKELAGYVNPKLKAIEHSKELSPLDGMADQQKLEAMKLALGYFEAQVKERKVGDGSNAT